MVIQSDPVERVVPLHGLPGVSRSQNQPHARDVPSVAHVRKWLSRGRGRRERAVPAVPSRLVSTSADDCYTGAC